MIFSIGPTPQSPTHTRVYTVQIRDRVPRPSILALGVEGDNEYATLHITGCPAINAGQLAFLKIGGANPGKILLSFDAETEYYYLPITRSMLRAKLPMQVQIETDAGVVWQSEQWIASAAATINADAELAETEAPYLQALDARVAAGVMAAESATTTADGSATAAGESEREAARLANVAETAKQAAETAASNAAGHADGLETAVRAAELAAANAASSERIAGGSATSAETSKRAAASSAEAAAGSAEAANESASTASDSANAAARSASTANGSAEAAARSAEAASASASAADTSSQSAETFAANASASAENATGAASELGASFALNNALLSYLGMKIGHSNYTFDSMDAKNAAAENIVGELAVLQVMLDAKNSIDQMVRREHENRIYTLESQIAALTI